MLTIKLQMKLSKREDCPEGYYYAYSEDGRKMYSVVDFGTMMSTHPTIENLKKAGLFLGWEAFEVISNHMDIDRQFRAPTWEELEKQICQS